MTSHEAKGWVFLGVSVWLLSVAMGVHGLAVENGIWAELCPVWSGAR